jgi:hypothetical protein
MEQSLVLQKNNNWRTLFHWQWEKKEEAKGARKQENTDRRAQEKVAVDAIQSLLEEGGARGELEKGANSVVLTHLGVLPTMVFANNRPPAVAFESRVDHGEFSPKLQRKAAGLKRVRKLRDDLIKGLAETEDRRRKAQAEADALALQWIDRASELQVVEQTLPLSVFGATVQRVQEIFPGQTEKQYKLMGKVTMRKELTILSLALQNNIIPARMLRRKPSDAFMNQCREISRQQGLNDRISEVNIDLAQLGTMAKTLAYVPTPGR